MKILIKNFKIFYFLSLIAPKFRCSCDLSTFFCVYVASSQIVYQNIVHYQPGSVSLFMSSCCDNHHEPQERYTPPTSLILYQPYNKILELEALGRGLKGRPFHGISCPYLLSSFETQLPLPHLPRVEGTEVVKGVRRRKLNLIVNPSLGHTVNLQYIQLNYAIKI